MDSQTDAEKEPTGKPAPADGLQASPQEGETPYEEPEPIEEAPEPLEASSETIETLKTYRKRTAFDTDIRQAVTETGHGSSGRGMPAVPEHITHETSVEKALEQVPTIEELDVERMSDEDLMKLCQEGDEGAFEVLFQRYEGPALSFINRMVGDRHRTEALGQEAFLRIFKDAKSYQYPRSFSTWFYTIVRNLCKNELRWRARHPTVSIEENVGGGRRSDPDSLHIGDNLRADASDPLEQMVSEELNSKLDRALKDLPDLERDILILKCFQGLKYREIAEVVGVPVGTVRSRIHVALERMRKQVKDYLP